MSPHLALRATDAAIDAACVCTVRHVVAVLALSTAALAAARKVKS